ncbi:hypothetical protein AMS69_01535 [Haloarcula rubripromontorii]|uniref:Uncharacterized protein n=1 Tax=Haloarcula rubripromontorii TaxID=1705562 RepID=A0A0M9ALN5_9EURY|nr:hypothetical protein AMS69_01535 [Haloarcula rubripromontorii]
MQVRVDRINPFEELDEHTQCRQLRMHTDIVQFTAFPSPHFELVEFASSKVVCFFDVGCFFHPLDEVVETVFVRVEGCFAHFSAAFIQIHFQCIVGKYPIDFRHWNTPAQFDDSEW